MEGIVDLYNYITGYLASILCFVTSLLIFVIFSHMDGRRHLKQAVIETKKDFTNWMRFVRNWTHSTSLELIWTIIPTLILIAIAVPSFILLYALDEIVDCQCIVKIVGYQWYWRYEYPVNYHENYDVLNVSVLSYMRPLEDLTKYAPNRLLEVDMPLVLPHSVNVKLIITSKDVLHSFAIPALGIKMDAVPGRLNQVTVFIIEPGVYYGQCSELCGVNHGYMPIVIHAISFELYEEFLMKIAFAQEKEKIQKALELLFSDDVFMSEISSGSSGSSSSEIPSPSDDLSDPNKKSEPIDDCPTCPKGHRHIKETWQYYEGEGDWKPEYDEFLLNRNFTPEEIAISKEFAYVFFKPEVVEMLFTPKEPKDGKDYIDYLESIDTFLDLKKKKRRI